MTRKEVFFFGAIGGVMPILVTIISVDLSPIIDNPDSLTLGNYIGFGLRVVALIIAGGVVALMNCNVKTPLTPVTLVQLGVTAPALLTSFINAGGPAKEASAALFRHASAPFAIVFTTRCRGCLPSTSARSRCGRCRRLARPTDCSRRDRQGSPAMWTRTS
jgi:hypothetical protein